MSQTWSELMLAATQNSQHAVKQLEKERRTRETLPKKPDISKSVNDVAIQKIRERQLQAQQLQRQAEQSIKANHQTKQLKKHNLLIKTAPPQKTEPEKKPPADSAKKTVASKKKPAPAVSYDDLMLYATLKANRQPIPKELAEAMKSVHGAKSTNSPKSSKDPVPSAKTTSTITAKLKTNTDNKRMSTSASNITKSKSTPTQPRPATTSLSVNRLTNGQKLAQNRTVNERKPVQKKPSSNSLANSQKSSQSNQITNTTKPSASNQSVNGKRPMPPPNKQRAPVPFSRKHLMMDTDDESDEEMRDFIVDDENDDLDYRKELQATLKSNFGFDREKYCKRYLDDDDDDDLANMESSFDRIQQEEEYSRRQGLREDIDDILREQAEKQRHRATMQKRPKIST